MVPYGVPNQGPNLWPMFAGIEPHRQHEHENNGKELASFWRSVISFAPSAIYLFHNMASCDIKDHRRPPPPRRSLVSSIFFFSSSRPNIDTRLTTSKSTVYRSSNFDRASVRARMRNAIGIGLRSQNLKISIRGHKATITADNECVWLVW